MECKCGKCGMVVKGLTCGKCHSALVEGTVVGTNNEKIKVAKCPAGCGQIKSPTCCGKDMECRS